MSDRKKKKINFAISSNLVIQPEEKKDACFTFYLKELNYEHECKTKKNPSSPLIWNPDTPQITAQQWQLESPQHEKQHTNEENQPLLAQYHQFVEDKAVARNNQLGETINWSNILW